MAGTQSFARPVRQPDVAPKYMDIGTRRKILVYIVLAFGAAIMLLPFVWMASTSCKPPVELNRLPVRFIPQDPACATNLDALYQTSPLFNRYLMNSFIVTVGRTLGQLIVCSLAAYGFARFRFPGRNILFAMCVSLPRLC